MTFFSRSLKMSSFTMSAGSPERISLLSLIGGANTLFTLVGDPLSPIPVSDPEGGPVTVTYISGELPPGITMNPDGTFSGVTTEIGTYTVVVEVCDTGDPQVCIEHTHTIAVTPVTLPGPPDDPDPDDPPPTLPFTGANFGELLVTALMLLLAGAGLVLFARKREQS